jgi:DNA polymerase
MENILESVKNLLKWYQQNYNERIYFNSELITNLEPPLTDSGGAPQGQKSAAASQIAVQQRSPELQSFYQEIKNCEKCPLANTRKNFVFGYGNPKADVLFIGEAPGEEEDIKGLPFVGRAGQLLDKMLAAIQLNRENVYIANIIKCRPPNNRDPLPEEISKCEPYLLKQLELIQPKILVGLGRVAASVLLKEEKTLREFRQTERRYKNIPLIITYHPAALLRNSQWKKSAWEDFKKVKSIIQN